MNVRRKEFQQRLRDSAHDFVAGVQGTLESQLQARIFPIEDLQAKELITTFDQVGIDAFYMDRSGDLRGLASRMNYSNFAQTKPQFSFRYGLFNEVTKEWDLRREFTKKREAANAPDQFVMFPKLHVESCCSQKRSGNIVWSFAAETKLILNYAYENMDNPDRVRIFTPKVGEKRQVLTVLIESFARDHRVLTVR